MNKYRDSSVVKQFEKTADKFSDNLAVKSKDCQYDYRELNQRSNQLADSILSINPNPGLPVALIFEHNAKMIIGLMGVLKAAKIYVPMDPYFSQERLSYIVDKSQACMIITDQNNIGLAMKLSGNNLPVINIDKMASDLDKKNPDISISFFDPAYIIFTSGTTKLPKGVIQNHGSVLRVASVHAENISISAGDRISMLSTFSFSISIIDIFSSLLSGAGLFLFDIKKEGVLQLSHWMREERITHCQMIPSVFNFLVNSLTEKLSLPLLRFLKLGGEPVYKKHFNSYIEYFPDHCMLVNGFGLSEILLVCVNIMSKNTSFEHWEIPVGKPCYGVDILLENEDGTPVKFGEVGEICINSKFLPENYWEGLSTNLKNSDLIDFEVMEKRIFRTGDMGILKPDGSYLHLGRKDDLVKLLGMKIDIGKLETALLSHNSVKDILIRRAGIDSSDDELEALIVLQNSQKPDPVNLIRYMKGLLDIPRIPISLKYVEDLPRTENGKLSRISPKSLLWEQVWTPVKWISMHALNSLNNKFIVIFTDSSGWGRDLGNSLKKQNGSVVMVEESEVFIEFEDNCFGIRIDSNKDFKKLWSKYLEPKSRDWVIIHCQGLFVAKEKYEKKDNLDHIINRSFFSQTYNFQAINELDLHLSLSYLVITGPLFQITGKEIINPLSATGIGHAMVIPYEFSNIQSHCIDITMEDENQSINHDRIIDLINMDQAEKLKPLIVIRNGKIYEQSLKPVTISDKMESADLRTNGVYIITGGLGMIGLKLAQYIASQVKSNIILIGSSDFPNRKDWPKLIIEKDNIVKKKINQINEIESNGSKVKIVRANVTKIDELESAFIQIISDFGLPDGIIHAAGIRKGIPLLQSSHDVSLEVFEPKIRGLLNLASLLDKHNPDFIILCSSFSVIQGRPGMAAYISANAFMDAFARSKNILLNRVQMISINWDSWEENRMSYTFNEIDNKNVRKKNQYIGLHTHDALSAFKLILKNKKSQIIVSNRILYSNYNRKETKDNIDADSFRHFYRSGLYIAPGNQIELQLTNLWESILNFQPLGINDNFFDLGGDSLTAMLLLLKMEKFTNKKLSPGVLLNNPSIAEMAKYLKDGFSQTTWKNLVPIKPVGQKKPFFCVHNRAGNVWGICRLRQFIDPGRPIYGLQARGISGEELPLDSVEAMAEIYLKEVLQVQSKGPFILGGRCFGGMVAYEMVQQLIKNKKDAPLLFIFEGPAPDLMFFGDQAKSIKEREQNISESLHNKVHFPAQSLYKSNIRELISKAHIKAIKNYSIGPYYGHLILILTKSPGIKYKNLIRRWKFLAKGKFTVHTIDCKKHNLMFYPPYGEVVGNIINHYSKKYS